MTVCEARPVLGLALLVASIVGMTGCTTTHTVSRTDRGALTQLNGELAGKTAEVVHATGRERVTRLRVSQDSTRWMQEQTRRSVPTEHVRAIVLNSRSANVKRWTAVGAGFFGLLSAQFCNEIGDSDPGCYVLFGTIGALGGGGVFSVYAALGTEVVEYVLLE